MLGQPSRGSRKVCVSEAFVAAPRAPCAPVRQHQSDVAGVRNAGGRAQRLGCALPEAGQDHDRWIWRLKKAMGLPIFHAFSDCSAHGRFRHKLNPEMPQPLRPRIRRNWRNLIGASTSATREGDHGTSYAHHRCVLLRRHGHISGAFVYRRVGDGRGGRRLLVGLSSDGQSRPSESRNNEARRIIDSVRCGNHAVRPSKHQGSLLGGLLVHRVARIIGPGHVAPAIVHPLHGHTVLDRAEQHA